MQSSHECTQRASIATARARRRRDRWSAAWRRGAALLTICAALLGASACDGDELDEDEPSATLRDDEGASEAGDSPSPDAAAEDDGEAPEAGVGEDVPSDTSDDPAPDATEKAPPPERPLGYRVSKRTTMIYFEPRFGSELRGRIDKGNSFAVYELVDTTGDEGECDKGDGWARVGARAYVCLRPHHEETETLPVVQPALLEGLDLPYIYGYPEQDRPGNVEFPVPRYSSKYAMFREHKPVDYLVGNRQYAFVELNRSAKFGKYLVDERERVVPAEHMKHKRTSEHFGRLLEQEPVAEGLAAGWVVRSDAEIKDRAHPERGKVLRKPDYHSILDVRPELERHKGESWYRVPDAVEAGVDGWVLKKHVKIWDPAEPLAEIEGDEYWIDIDLAQQVLALYRGETVELITLISSGNGKHPTPRGVFRLRGKQSVGKMESKDDAQPDEEYYVEAVPWVQYFYKRYALHTAYWHRRFGHQHSHGCVNLAPKASKYVFERTAPHLPKGWSSANETPEEMGTVIRLRRRDDEIPDKRKPVDIGGGGDDEDDED